MVDLGKFFGWSNTMKRGTTVLVSMGRLLGISGLFMALLCAVSQVSAQVAYPTKPIRFLIGSGPGGLADVTTRLIGCLALGALRIRRLYQPEGCDRLWANPPAGIERQ